MSKDLKISTNENGALQLQLQPKEVVDANSFLGRLAQIMADDQVKSFFSDYFSTWPDTKAALMLMHTYVAIDDAYAREYGGKRLPSDQIAAVVREMVGDRECRKLIVSAMSHYTSSESDVTFLQAYKQIAAKHEKTPLPLENVQD